MGQAADQGFVPLSNLYYLPYRIEMIKFSANLVTIFYLNRILLEILYFVCIEWSNGGVVAESVHRDDESGSEQSLLGRVK